MGAMKSITTKLQHGLRLNNDEKKFVKVFCSKPKKLKKTDQLELDFGMSKSEMQELAADIQFERDWDNDLDAFQESLNSNPAL